MNENISPPNELKEPTLNAKYNRKRKCSFDNSTNILSNNLHENYPYPVNHSNDVNKTVQVNYNFIMFLNHFAYNYVICSFHKIVRFKTF